MLCLPIFPVCGAGEFTAFFITYKNSVQKVFSSLLSLIKMFVSCPFSGLFHYLLSTETFYSCNPWDVLLPVSLCKIPHTKKLNRSWIVVCAYLLVSQSLKNVVMTPSSCKMCLQLCWLASLPVQPMKLRVLQEPLDLLNKLCWSFHLLDFLSHPSSGPQLPYGILLCNTIWNTLSAHKCVCV